jgi:ceramide glucosyltransferase
LLGEQKISRKLLIFLLQGWHPFLLVAMFVMVALHHTQDVLIVIAGVLVMRWLLISTLNRRLFGPFRVRPILSLLSELLQPFHFLHALFVKRIDWRGRRYRVHASDRFEATDG